jgi:hypothetical protein
VSNPANPIYLDDSDYPAVDRETIGLAGGPYNPEGNAHQGEWNHNGRWWIGTDEDFGPHRALITTEDEAYPGGQFSWTPPIESVYDDGQFNGPGVWGGRACGDGADPNVPNADPATDSIPDAEDYTVGDGEEKILVTSRGVCFFSIKVDNAQRNGWDAVVMGNSHAGTQGGLTPNGFLCGSQGHDFTAEIPGLCTGHRAMHEMFDDAPAYSGADEADMPARGTVGKDLIGRADFFDGWGYVNLLNRNLNHVASYAPPKVHDPDCATGCGIMSVHEVATDRRKGKNIAYFSWYGLGLRVAKFGRTGIKEVGVYMDVGGNDIWGIDVVPRGPNRRPLLVGSDRDSGLWIFKYTGPE